ncbi:MAG: phosphatase PAP2 family protein [Rhizomicrobium sp.]
MSRNIVLACAFVGLACTAPAQASSNIESAGTDVAIALPVVAGGITLWKDDWTGSAQLFVDTGLTVGTAYVLKHLVRECRPFAHPCSHGSTNWDSFPSDTAALAFAPAQFLWDRYGWEYGLPAYAAASFAGYSRVDAKKHHWWDVAASAAFSFGYSKLITTEYHPTKSLYTDLEASPDGVYATVNYRW